jgi:dienelactone hydrolase
MKTAEIEQLVRVPAGGDASLEGNLAIPQGAQGLVLFAHGSGSSRHSPRNRFVADYLRQQRFATLLIDLLTPAEERVDLVTRELRFDIGLLADRLVHTAHWVSQNRETQTLRIGYFGASTGAGAALVAATRSPENIGAIVSRGGRPDLAGLALAEVRAPTLLIVGGDDFDVIELNRRAYRLLHAEKRMTIIPGASHLFEEAGTLEEAARLAAEWFMQWLVE